MSKPHENPPPYSSQPPPPGFTQPAPGYPQPAPGYPHPAPTAHVIVTSGATTGLGPQSQRITCPSCNGQISTSVKVEPNTKTHLFAVLLCIFQCWLCCWVPYCVDSCQSRNHYCPICHAYIGSYHS